MAYDRGPRGLNDTAREKDKARAAAVGDIANVTWDACAAGLVWLTQQRSAQFVFAYIATRTARPVS